MNKLMFLMLISHLAYGGVNEDKNLRLLESSKIDWESCINDDDCKIAVGLCGVPLAINLSSEKSLNKYFSEIKPDALGCIDFMSPPWPSGVVCEKKSCTLKYENHFNQKKK